MTYKATKNTNTPKGPTPVGEVKFNTTVNTIKDNSDANNIKRLNISLIIALSNKNRKLP